MRIGFEMAWRLVKRICIGLGAFVDHRLKPIICPSVADTPEVLRVFNIV